MKNILLILIPLLAFSCTENILGGENNQNKQLDNIDLTNILCKLPLDNLEANSKVIFSNESGEEKILDISINQEIKLKNHNGIIYEAEQISVLYIDHEIDEYSLSYTCSGNYSGPNDDVSLFVFASLFHLFDYRPSISVDQNGNSLFDLHFDNLEIAGRNFHDVFTNMERGENLPYGKIFYNTEFGIIGFADRDGVIFSFKEFIE